jgi:hypothetical protein
MCPTRKQARERAQGHAPIAERHDRERTPRIHMMLRRSARPVRCDAADSQQTPWATHHLHLRAGMREEDSSMLSLQKKRHTQWKD